MTDILNLSPEMPNTAPDISVPEAPIHKVSGPDVIDMILSDIEAINDALDIDSLPTDIDNPLLRGAMRMKQLSVIHDAAKKLVRRLDEEYDRLRLKELPELMLEDNIRTVSFSGLGRVQLGSDVYASIPAPKRDEAWQWLRDNNSGDLITETVNSSTLKAWAKEKIAAGVELPDCFTVTPFNRVSIVKGK